jgi:hypothetical protein
MREYIKAKDVKQSLVQYMRRVPDFLDTTSSINHMTYLQMLKCNNVLLNLVNERTMQMRTVDSLINDYMNYINALAAYIDDTQQIKISIYYIELIDYMLEVCESAELFESCANIKKFNEKFYTIISMTDDE